MSCLLKIESQQCLFRLIFCCFVGFASISKCAELHFAQLSEPHIFDALPADTRNQDAFVQAAANIRQHVSAGLYYDFVVVTGDLGLKVLFAGSNAVSVSSQRIAEAATQLADLIVASNVRTWYFLPGETDLGPNSPYSTYGYSRFIGVLADQTAPHGIVVRDLTGTATNRLVSSLELTRGDTRWQVVGINNTSFAPPLMGMSEAEGQHTNVLNDVDLVIGSLSFPTNILLFYHYPQPATTLGVSLAPGQRQRWSDAMAKLKPQALFSGHMPVDNIRHFGPYQLGADGPFAAPPLGFSANERDIDLNRGYAEIWYGSSSKQIRHELVWLTTQVVEQHHSILQEVIAAVGSFVVCGCLVAVMLNFGYPWLKRSLGGSREAGLNNAALMGSLTVCLFLIGLAALSCIGFCAAGRGFPVFCVGMLWALASAATGGALGFLFGIPRRTTPPASRTPGTGSGSGTTPTSSVPGQPAGASAGTEVTTSLDEIADWLTKLIVGGTVFQVGKVLPMLKQGGDHFAAAMDSAKPELWSSIGSTLLVYFGLVGICGGYFSGRLYLNRALRDADSGERVIKDEAALEEHVVASLDDAPLSVENQTDDFAKADPVAHEAAKKIVAEVPIERLSNWRDIRIWAKANFLLGKYDNAIAGYQRAVSIVPRDPETRLGYAVALSEKGAATSIVLAQLEAARRSLSPSTRQDLCRSIFKSLMYCSLYLDSPESFLKTLSYARELHTWHESALRESSAPSGYFPETAGMWINIACAYGQAYRWFKNAPAERPPAISSPSLDQLLAWPGQTLPTEASKMQWLVDQATYAIDNALRSNAGAIHKVKVLFEGGTPDDDLAAFKDDPGFRQRLNYWAEQFKTMKTPGESAEDGPSHEI